MKVPKCQCQQVHFNQRCRANFACWALFFHNWNGVALLPNLNPGAVVFSDALWSWDCGAIACNSHSWFQHCWLSYWNRSTLPLTSCFRWWSWWWLFEANTGTGLALSSSQATRQSLQLCPTDPLVTPSWYTSWSASLPRSPFWLQALCMWPPGETELISRSTVQVPHYWVLVSVPTGCRRTLPSPTGSGRTATGPLPQLLQNENWMYNHFYSASSSLFDEKSEWSSIIVRSSITSSESCLNIKKIKDEG